MAKINIIYYYWHFVKAHFPLAVFRQLNVASYRLQSDFAT